MKSLRTLRRLLQSQLDHQKSLWHNCQKRRKQIEGILAHLITEQQKISPWIAQNPQFANWALVYAKGCQNRYYEVQKEQEKIDIQQQNIEQTLYDLFAQRKTLDHVMDKRKSQKQQEHERKDQQYLDHNAQCQRLSMMNTEM